MSTLIHRLHRSRVGRAAPDRAQRALSVALVVALMSVGAAALQVAEAGSRGAAPRVDRRVAAVAPEAGGMPAFSSTSWVDVPAASADAVSL